MELLLKRFIIFIVVLILVLMLPWWLSVALLLGLSITVSFFIEVLFFAFLLDVLYAPAHTFHYGLFSAAVLFLAITLIRPRLRR